MRGGRRRPWCAAAGRALHVDGRKVHTPEVAREVLAEAGLDPAAVDAAVADPTTHDDWSSPTTAASPSSAGSACRRWCSPATGRCSGPSCARRPRAPPRQRLWDLVTGWLEFPALYEVRRPKTADDWARIGETLRPLPVGPRLADHPERGALSVIDRRPRHAVAVLDEQFDAVVALAEGLGARRLGPADRLPGLVGARTTSCHVIGIEAMLLGRPTPEVTLPDDLPHVRNDFGRVNEQWIEAYRERSTTEVLADLREVIAERRAALAGMDQAAFDAESFTPAGPTATGGSCAIRVMDMWMHEQDIREAVGRPGHEDGQAPQAALDEMTAVLGYVVGKRAGAPPGSRVRFELTGSMARRVDVEVGDRARVVEHARRRPDGHPHAARPPVHPALRGPRGRCRRGARWTATPAWVRPSSPTWGS